MTQPHILFIVLDTLRRDRLSAYGHHRETSPAFDAFADRATLFERAISPAQWTIPAHASLFTGDYPGVHGLTQADGSLTPDLPALAELLSDSDYHTVGFCNNPLVGVLENGLQRGFDAFYNYAGAAPNRPVDMRRNRVHRRLSRQFRRFARLVSNQFAHRDWMFRLSLHPLFVPLWTRAVNYKGHTQKSIDDLIDYWAAHTAGAAERPLFAFLNLMGAHLPYRPPRETLDRVAPHLHADKQAFGFMSRFNAEAARWASPTDPPLADWQRRTIADFYDAEIAHQDAHLGRLLRWLEASGDLDHTLVIITADHGEGHGDHNFFGHSFVVYQELVHVPLIIRYPDRFPAGRRIATNVSTRRLFHTVLDVAGIRAHDHAADAARLTLASSCNGQPDPERGVAFAEAFPPRTFLNVLAHHNPALIERLALTRVRRGVYAGAHKLITSGAQVDGLFDVQRDPAEVQDVAGANPDLVASLRRKIDYFVAESESRRAAVGRNGTVDADVMDNLRALGYIE